DLRSTAQRERQGVLAGAIAIDARYAVDLLDPASPSRVRSVTSAEGGVLVSDDGFEAELFAWELRAHGTEGVRALAGGFEALQLAGGVRILAGAQHVRSERSAIAAHWPVRRTGTPGARPGPVATTLGIRDERAEPRARDRHRAGRRHPRAAAHPPR